MTDPRLAIALGALMAEALQPQRVKDLEAFFAQHPDAYAMVEAKLGGGLFPQIALSMPSPVEPMVMAPEGMNEAGIAGPEPGAEPLGI